HEPGRRPPPRRAHRGRDRRGARGPRGGGARHARARLAPAEHRRVRLPPRSLGRGPAAAARGEPAPHRHAAVRLADVPGPGRARGEFDTAPWRAAAEAWQELDRPYRALYLRWRQAEALVGAGDRAAAADVAFAALVEARELGSDWLAGELESLAARARLRLP